MRRTLQTASIALDWLISEGVQVEIDADWQEIHEKRCKRIPAAVAVSTELSNPFSKPSLLQAKPKKPKTPKTPLFSRPQVVQVEVRPKR
jgi:hypothetical protein